MFVTKPKLDYTNSFASIITHSLELILFTSEFICLIIPFPSFDCRVSYHLNGDNRRDEEVGQKLSLLLSEPSNALLSPSPLTTCFSFMLEDDSVIRILLKNNRQLVD